MTTSSITQPLQFEGPATVLNALRGHGLRISTARRIVVHTLFAAEGPVSAEEIAAGLDGDRTRLDLASVYRNLETLEELGVVRHFHAGHGPGRYVLAGGGEREYLACERCSEVIEVEGDELNLVRAEIRERFGYEARFTHFPVVGLCHACAHEGVSR